MRKNQFAAEAEAAFRKFVLRPEFPCLGAKAAFNSGSQTLRVFDELGSAESTNDLVAALYAFTHLVGRDSVEPNHRAASDPGGSRESRPTEYASFIAIFERPRQTNEQEFESLLWKQLRLLHEHDAAEQAWDPGVSGDPADPHFSFSFGGQALYVIGMHANSSREARRFPWPALVFNPHEQFERLRADGKWKHMQQTIRQRDLELQGTINPMLSDFGERSEARQYSGRIVEENWRAPFPAASGKCPFAH
ncbi:MAG: guanitoxin biosynthesis heme-dependent pre-guanitoxin N-hydroxylase GntA [Chthoniobacterales bacterium]